MSWLIRMSPALLLVLVETIATSAQSPPPFTVGIELPSQIPVSPAVEGALRDMGIGYLNTYVTTLPGNPDLPPSETAAAVRDLCSRLHIDFSLATHLLDPPDQTIRESVAWGAAPDQGGRFRGTVIDELAHIRLLHFKRQTALADYKSFQNIDQAWRETVEGFTRLRQQYEELGSPLVATHVIPVLLHAAARAGCTPCPKICKELYSPVSLAIGMGAAKQYGRHLWVDCDLWYWDLLPGHEPEELRSNLLLAYWLGADLVYIEGAGHNLTPAGKQGVPFSLMTQITPDTYQLTAHGEVLRWFCREYLPAHPRSWTFRDVKPNIAIVRMDDTAWGQRYALGFTKGLFGTEHLACGPDNEAWFQIMNILTCGKTGRDGVTYFKAYNWQTGYHRPSQPHVQPSLDTRPLQADWHRFWTPLNGVVVYDHTVGFDLLKDIPVLFLTGPQIEPDTFAAVKRCVAAGARCVVWAPLAERMGISRGTSGVAVQPEENGKWIITDDFGLSEVQEAIWPFIGHPDEIKYRFAEHTVILRRVTDDVVRVEVDGKIQ